MPFFPSSWSKYLRNNPLAIGAAITAPFFASSEDRGYFQTSMLTTPLVFAANAVLPSVFDVTKKSVAQAASSLQNLEKSAIEFSGVTRDQLVGILSNRAYSDTAVAKAVQSYLGGSSKESEGRRLANALKEKNGVTKYFYKKFVVTPELENILNSELPTSKRGLAASKRLSDIIATQGSKRKLLSNALDAAVRDAATPGEWRELARQPNIAYSNDELLNVFRKNADRPNFIRGLNSRLRKIDARGLVDAAGIPLKPDSGIREAFSVLRLTDDGFNTSNVNLWKNIDPEVARNLQSYMKRKKIGELTAIAEKVTDGKVGRIFSIDVGTYTDKYGKANQPFRLLLPDANSLVNVDDSGLKYVSRHILDARAKAHRIDRWLSKQLAENDFSFDQLADEASRGYIYHAVDVDDEFKMGMVKGAEGSGSPLFWEDSARAKATAVHSSLPVYADNKLFTDLDPAQQWRWTESVVNTGRFPVMISESGVAEGRFAMPGLEQLHPFGLANAEKQDPVFRSITKEFRLSSTNNEYMEKYKSPFTNSSYQELLGTSKMPEVGMTTGGIEAPIKNLLGDLPADMSSLEANKANLISQMTGMMGNESGAMSMYEDIVSAYKSNKGKAPSFLTDLGRLGETEFMMSSDLADQLGVESRFRYELDESWVKPGDTINPNQVLGITNREAVLPDFPGVVESIIEREGTDGRSTLHAIVKHDLTMHGAKVDVAGIKGQSFVVGEEQFDQTLQFMNKFYSRSGRADYLNASVTALADLSYFTNKAEAATANLSIANDLLKGLDQSGLQEIQKLIPEYHEMLDRAGVKGIKFDAGQLHIDSSFLPSNADMVVERQLRAERMIAFSKVNEEFFAKAGKAVAKARLLDSDLLHGVPDAALTNLRDWTLRNHFTAPLRAWDHAAAYVSKQLTITHDVQSFMAMEGQFGALKTLNESLVTVGGDKAMALDFGKHIFGNSNAPLGKVFTRDQVKLFDGSLRSAASRAGTVLDPSLDQFKQNFTIDLGEGAKHRYVPVLGTEAFGGVSHLYGPGEYETWDWQKSLQQVLNGSDQNAVKNYFETLKNEVFTGKEGALRPRSIAKNGVSGFLATKGGANPFEVTISPDVASRIRSKSIRNALSSGEDAYGMLLRQPISSTAHVKVKVDKSLRGTHWISANEELYRLFQGDADKDPVGLLMWERGSEGFSEAKEMIASGQQSRAIQRYKDLIGNKDFSRSQKVATLENLTARTEETATKSSAGLLRSLRGRMASATIGSYSNLLTGVVENVVRNPAIYRDRELAGRLKDVMFQLRQAPISARKATQEVDLEMARGYVGELGKHLREIENPNEAAKAFHGTMTDLMERLYGPENKLVKDYLRTDLAQNDVLQLMRGRTKAAEDLTAMYTQSGNRVSRLVKRVFNDPWKALGTVHGGMAEVSASVLGEMAQEASSAASKVRYSAAADIRGLMKAHGGKIALLGLGIAAYGAMSRPKRASFDMPSASRMRPETHISALDHVPGESYEGARAPSNPPRRLVRGPNAVRTAMVAPMRQSVDLEVRMKSPDKDAATERARVMANMVPGSSHTLINYKSDTSLYSLRMREKMRDLRDET